MSEPAEGEAPIESVLQGCIRVLTLLELPESVQFQLSEDQDLGPHIEALASIGDGQYVGGAGATVSEAAQALLLALHDLSRRRYLALSGLFADAALPPAPQPLAVPFALRIVPKAGA